MSIIAIALVARLGVPAERPEATFHLIQIQQILGGVNGDPTIQAIQLRMRAAHQNELEPASLWALDANGENPVLIVDFQAAVEIDDLGATVLIATPDFSANASPPIDPDYIMENTIPTSYLEAGSLIFTDDVGGLVLWRLCWGAYQGDTTGTLTNDLDGEYGPPHSGTIPIDGLDGVSFLHKADAFSTTNADDYLATGGGAIFTNNSGFEGEVVGVLDPCAMDCGQPDGVIDINDLLAVLIQYFTPPPQPCDFWPPSGDGQVDTPELQLLLENWGPCDG